MTLRNKGAAGLITLMLTTGMFSGCSQASSTSNTDNGQGTKVEETIYEKVNQTIKGKQVETNRLLKNLYEITIVNKDKKDSIEVKVTIKESYVKEEQDKKVTAEYDSINGLNVTDPLASPIITVYAAATGESFNAVLDDKGNVEEVNGVIKLQQKMMDKLKINDENVKSKLQPTIKSEFGEKALKDKLQNIIIKQIADKKFSAGDNWTNKEKINIGTETTINTNYKVAKNSDNTCYVNMEGKTSSDIKSDIIENDGIEFSYSGSCGESGSLEIDKQSGVLSKANIVSKFSGNMEIKDGPKDLKGKKIPTDIEIQVYIGVKK